MALRRLPLELLHWDLLELLLVLQLRGSCEGRVQEVQSFLRAATAAGTFFRAGAGRTALRAGGAAPAPTWVRIEIPKDGNCFYSSLSFALFVSLNASKALRAVICKYISNNWLNFKGFAGAETRASFCATHSRDGAFATELQIRAAADLLGLEIVVVLPDRQVNFKSVRRTGVGEPVKVHLLFTPPWDCGHFDCLLPPNFKKPSYNLELKFNGQSAQPCARASGVKSYSAACKGAGTAPPRSHGDGPGQAAATSPNSDGEIRARKVVEQTDRRQPVTVRPAKSASQAWGKNQK